MKESVGKEMHTKYMSTIYPIILLLIKINGLLDLSPKVDEDTLRFLHGFIDTCYSLLNRAAFFPEMAESMRKFNRHFFTIVWNKERLDNEHTKLICKVLKESKAGKLSLDS